VLKIVSVCQSASARGYTRAERYRTGTNLCHFFRTLLLGSLLFALIVAFYCYLFFVAVILPLMLFPTLFVAQTVLLMLFAFGSSAGLIAGLLLCGPKVSHWLGGWTARRRAKHPPRVASGPGFWRTAFSYYRAVKAEICPIVAFKEMAPHDLD